MVLLLINNKSYDLDNKVISVDKSAKCAYIYLKNFNDTIGKIWKTQDINPNKHYFMMNLDIDKNKNPLGIEIIFKDIRQLDTLLKGIVMVYPSIKIIDITEGFQELVKIKGFEKLKDETNEKEIYA